VKLSVAWSAPGPWVTPRVVVGAVLSIHTGSALAPEVFPAASLAR
jgi:hypothetical protein